MSQTTRELITLQVGHHANFIGTHWWNLQEASFVYNAKASTDINHDFLFREGITSQRQETYTPRLLAIDLKGSLHSLPIEGTLYSDSQTEPSTSEAAWDGQLEFIHQLPQEKNQFLKDLEQEDAQIRGLTDEDKDICIDDSKTSECDAISTNKTYDLTKSVKVWSDFLRPHLHPKSIYLLDNSLCNVGRHSAAEGNENVWGFSSGYSAFQRDEVEEEIVDRIRCLAESSNSLQGFQILSDIHDGMGGVTYGILQHLADEYGSKDSITFTTSPPHYSAITEPSRLLMQGSIIQSFTELSQLSSILIPLNMRKSVLDLEAPFSTFKHLAMKDYNAYLTSSVMAAFLDTVSVSYRSRTLPIPLANVVEFLTVGGRKVAGGSLSLPLGIKSSQTLLEWLQDEEESSSSVSVSGGCTYNVEPLSELLTIRGIPQTRLTRSDMKCSRRSYKSAIQLYEEFLQNSCKPPSQRLVSGALDPLKIPPPFPRIFSQSVTHDGYIDTHNTPSVDVRSAPCLAGLHQSRGLGILLQHLLISAKKFNVMKVPSFLEDGIDKDSWATLTEELEEFVNNYCSNSERMISEDD